MLDLSLFLVCLPQLVITMGLETLQELDHLPHRFHDVVALDDLLELHVLVVEPLSLGSEDEELRFVGPGAKFTMERMLGQCAS